MFVRPIPLRGCDLHTIQSNLLTHALYTRVSASAIRIVMKCENRLSRSDEIEKKNIRLQTSEV